MKRPSSPHRVRRNLILAALLAALCIGATELAACRYYEPALYAQLTAPVRRGAQATAAACARTATALSQAAAQAHRQISLRVSTASAQISALWVEFTAPREALSEEDAQLAGEPVLTGEEPATDPAVTELNTIDGQDILTGGTIPIVYYYQAGEPWADLPYGADDIGRYGCGPTAMSMVVSSMTEADVDPAEMAQWAVSHGYWARRSGSYLSIVAGVSAGYGLVATPIQERTADAVQSALAAGNLLVALMGPGHFTKGGHFIVLRGVTLSGDLLVADPNSQERSLMEWAPELILEELSASTSDGAPLWVISPFPGDGDGDMA